MLVSVYTPTNNPMWLRETYSSLVNQTYKNWEWIVVPNSKTQATDAIKEEVKLIVKDDSRVKIFPHFVTDNVGGLKQFACSKTKGDFLLELDHDDMLTHDCLETLIDTHTKTNAGFFYSDWIEFKPDGSCSVYSPDYGWENYATQIDGKFMRAVRAFTPSARSLCEIYYAPNHIRAWTREAYEKSGGYNLGMIVADDHDLVCRTYLSGVEFAYIDKPIYLYRLHESNTVKLFNAQIQTQQADNKNRYIHQLIKEECNRKNLTTLLLGSFTDIFSQNIDAHTLKERDWKIDKESNSVGLVKADDFLQLVPTDKVMQVMEEIYRILVPGGWFLSSVPSTDGRGAFQDLRHVSYWNENSWWYWTNKISSKMYYPDPDENTPRFQSVRCWTTYPSDWHKQNKISYCYADLCALKGQRHPGPK